MKHAAAARGSAPSCSSSFVARTDTALAEHSTDASVPHVRPAVMDPLFKLSFQISVIYSSEWCFSVPRHVEEPHEELGKRRCRKAERRKRAWPSLGASSIQRVEKRAFKSRRSSSSRALFQQRISTATEAFFQIRAWCPLPFKIQHQRQTYLFCSRKDTNFQQQHLNPFKFVRCAPPLPSKSTAEFLRFIDRQNCTDNPV